MHRRRLSRILFICLVFTVTHYILQARQQQHQQPEKNIVVVTSSAADGDDERANDDELLWTSPHLVDCKQLLLNISELQQRQDDGIFVQTNTTPSFQMNIYNPSKDGVSKAIFDDGCWECNHIKDMLSALKQYNASYFLDVGGNIGMWSLTAAAAGYSTYTIEPLRDNCIRVCKSVDKNDFYNRVHLLNVAATTTDTTFRLNVPSGNIGGTSVVRVDNNNTKHDDDDSVIKGVPINTLNLPIDNNRPVVMKVDVEGHELEALFGASTYLKNTNIVYAMMELRPNLHRTNTILWKSVFEIFISKGLKPYRLNYEDETPLDVNKLDEWKHFKHPIVRYYDVVWRLDDFVRM